MDRRSAFVAGATGVVGSEVLEQLLTHPDYLSVASLTRRPLECRHERLRAEVGSYDSLEQYAPILNVDDVYCCLGTTLKAAGSRAAFERVDHDYVVALARCAESAGARQFLLVSAVGADADSRVFYNRIKGRAERDVRAVPFKAIHIFQPSLLLGPRRERRTGEAMAKAVMPMLNPLLPGRFAKYRGVEASRVARSMVAAATADMKGAHVHWFGGDED